RDHTNFAAALAWCHDHSEEKMQVGLGSALSRYWVVRGFLVEAERWSFEALRVTEDADPELRGLALTSAWGIAFHRGDLGRAKVLAREVLALETKRGNRRGVAGALGTLAIIATAESDFVAARSLYREILPIVHESDDEWGIATALVNLGYLELACGQLEDART